MLEHEWWLRPVVALLAGALVGLERSYHGRAAGLRTYALVCLGSALLVTLAEQLEPAGDPSGSTRVIQGIVTGIGFLGAGVIIKEGSSVRGLTTAASIWVISAVGVVIGAGYYLMGAVATALTLALLSILRTIEDRLHSQSFYHCHLSFRRDQVSEEDWLRKLVAEHGFSITDLSYRLDRETGCFEYRFVMWSVDRDASGHLARTLLALPSIADFRISPSRD
ncbi:MAG: MgtC/SapB family protein [Betaproteobacteria bacterium]|nr:MAG: MgtC/SapB family protein [Betaproteobacteria bacterium]